MNPSVPRVGLVGLGGFAQSHLTRLYALHEAGICRLVAAADPFASRHSAIVAGLDACGIPVRDGLESMLGQDGVDAVFLATPIQLHAPQAVIALNAGKHVYLEKPPCATLGEWKAMQAAQEQSGKICVVGFQMQSHPAMRFLRRSVLEGRIGKLRRVWGSIRWRRTDSYYNRSPWVARWYVDGQPVFDGPATNALAHVVHAALALASDETETMPVLEAVRGNLSRARAVESYDSVLAEAKTQNGVEIRLAFTHATRFHDEVLLSLEGDAGQAHIDWRGHVRMQPTGEAESAYHFPSDNSSIATLDFLRAVADGSHRPSVLLQDTLPFVQFVNGALQSSAGSLDLPSELVERVEPEDGDGFYTVAGLDEQMAAFRANFEAQPKLLSVIEQPWVTPAEIGDSLSGISAG